jgi:hypothetical protein
MSTFLRRGFTLFLLLLAAALLHPVDTTAQNLPGWAEPSEQRQSRFETPYQYKEKTMDRSGQSRQLQGSERKPTSLPGARLRNGGGDGGGSGPPPYNPGQCKKATHPIPECTQLCSEKPGNKNCKKYFDETGATPIPIDDYLPFLMLAGIAYAALRLRQ